MQEFKRCTWVPLHDPLYVQYHDCEWGVPVHDDRLLFEFLILEGAQAGLSWAIILHKRENYRRLCDDFSPEKIARYDTARVEALLEDAGIVRNRRKVEAMVGNARACLQLQAEYGSLDAALWRFVDHTPRHNAWKTVAEVPARTPEAETMSRFLLKCGMKFVGPTICYAFMQAVGMVNDHTTDCFRYEEVQTIYHNEKEL